MDELENSNLLDTEQIDMLVEAGGDDSYALFGEILDLYTEESELKVQEIQDLRDTGDIEALGRSAHALAGSSANIGAKEVWRISKIIENHCKAGEGTDAIAAIDSLLAAYTTTVRVLQELRRSGTAT